MVGLAIAQGSLWILLTAVAAHLLMQTYVIAPEEAFLERKFGQDYLHYKQATRRWI